MDELIPLRGEDDEQGEDREELEERGALDEQTDEIEDQGTEEEDDRPDDLLDEDELVERRERREARADADQRQREDARNATVDGMRQFFEEIKGSRRAEPAPEQEEKPLPTFDELFRLKPEKAKELTEQILSDPSGGGLANALMTAAKLGAQVAEQRILARSGGLVQTSAEVISDRYLARKAKDPAEKSYRQIEPLFEEILAGYDTATLAQMKPNARAAWLDGIWDQAAGRFFRKGGTRAAPSPGVGRGAGSRGGAPGKSRLVRKMTVQEKADLRASAPNHFSGEEGERRFRRQVAEIENNVTRDPKIARAVSDSERFAKSVGFGG